MTTDSTPIEPTEATRAIREALGLFASCIRSGEDWSPTCDRVLARAREGLAALERDAGLTHECGEGVDIPHMWSTLRVCERGGGHQPGLITVPTEAFRGVLSRIAPALTDEARARMLRLSQKLREDDLVIPPTERIDMADDLAEIAAPRA